ncbi:MAG: PhoH family protein, partial [Bacteroidota bacterium]
MVEKKLNVAGIDSVQLLGFNDVHLQLIEDRFDATIAVRGDQITLRGSQAEVGKVEKIFKELMYILNKNGNLTPNDVETVIDLVSVNGSTPEVPL